MVREIAARLAERLHEVGRKFPLALDIGCHRGELHQALAATGDEQVGRLVQTDISASMARAACMPGAPALAADEEALPFAPAAFDLVASCASLHLVNDLPGLLLQIRYALKPGGLFLASFYGRATLSELRRAWLEAEAERLGGASPRIAPFADLRDAAGLLQRAGFIQPVADGDTIAVSYADPMALMADLKAMGESNPLTARSRKPTTRGLLAAAAERYRADFADADGRVQASFEVLTLTAWAPGETVSPS
ncbi:MAG: methyltransferase domain-containing protein [Alphaproteobacteria bacterium]|nr:methyltransferase domain-containing protein [Alphaproteobacteria bacterium]